MAKRKPAPRRVQPPLRAASKHSSRKIAKAARDGVKPNLEPDDTLSELERKFCDEYVVDCNGANALRRAGSQATTIASLSSQASRMLTQLNVQQRILALRDLQGQQNFDLARQVLERYRAMAFADPRLLFDERGNLRPIHDLDDETITLIAGFEAKKMKGGVNITKVKHVDQRAALDSISRTLGTFVEKSELSGPNGRPLAFGIVNITLADEKGDDE
jgi:phage terminase small subunit